MDTPEPPAQKGISPKLLHAFKVFAQARKLANDDCLVEAYEIFEYHKQLARAQNDDELLEYLKQQEARFDQKYLNDT